MHIEAELDEARSQRLISMQQRLQKPLTEIATEILAKAIDAGIEANETEGQKMLRIFSEEGLIGCIHGDGKLSVDYKEHLWGNE